MLTLFCYESDFRYFTNGNNDVGTGDRVYRQTPEMNKSTDVDQGQNNTAKYLEFNIKKRHGNISPTCMLAEKLKSKIHVVIKTQVMASKTFL